MTHRNRAPGVSTVDHTRKAKIHLRRNDHRTRCGVEIFNDVDHWMVVEVPELVTCGSCLRSMNAEPKGSK